MPGLKYMDAMLDRQDEKDRAALIVENVMARRVADAARPTEPTGSPVQPTKQSKGSA
jgi:hypothetical protein